MYKLGYGSGICTGSNRKRTNCERLSEPEQTPRSICFLCMFMSVPYICTLLRIWTLYRKLLTSWPSWNNSKFNSSDDHVEFPIVLVEFYQSQPDTSTDKSHSLDPVPRFLDGQTETSDSDSPEWLPNQNLFRWLSINDIEPILLKLRIKFYFSLFPFPIPSY